MRVYLLVLILDFAVLVVQCVQSNQSGFLVFCPCMGRFGNQMEQFLGVLAFTKALNRTLVLPPLIEYRTGETRSVQVPFDTYFDVAKVQEYHRAMLMLDFMTEQAPVVWPQEKRVSFCYMERSPIPKNGESDPLLTPSCNAKLGNPFGPFWDEFGVDFVSSEFFGPLNYDIHHGNTVRDWTSKFPAYKYPVLAFSGAPASFPVQKENAGLQKFVRFSAAVQARAEAFVQRFLRKGAYIGIHLRNGLDWTKACQHVSTSANLFSSPQCLGHRNEFGHLTQEMCLPSKEVILRQLKRQLKTYKEHSRDEVRAVFVASDKNHMLRELEEGLSRLNVDVITSESDDHILDLAVLIRSNHFIGNCVSSFSAFVKRSRDALGFKSSFWAFPSAKPKRSGNQKETQKLAHGEL